MHDLRYNLFIAHMSKPFDATTKQLVEARPADWVRFFGLPGDEHVSVIDADLATITTEADRVLRVELPDAAYLLHIEFQAGRDDIVERTFRYNALLWYRHQLPVQSVIVLLRPAADTSSITGRLESVMPSGTLLFDFRYQIVRLWEQDPDTILAGGLATLPLAPLAAATPDALPSIIRQMQARIGREATPRMASDLWVSTFLLLGLRYNSAFIVQLLRGIQDMEESSTYQLLISRGEEKGRAEGMVKGKAEGKAEGERALLLRLGSRRLGTPPAIITEAIAAITSPERLELLADRLLEVETWDELLTEQKENDA